MLRKITMAFITVKITKSKLGNQSKHETSKSRSIGHLTLSCLYFLRLVWSKLSFLYSSISCHPCETYMFGKLVEENGSWWAKVLGFGGGPSQSANNPLATKSVIVPYLSSLSLSLFDDFCSFLLFYLFFFVALLVFPRSFLVFRIHTRKFSCVKFLQGNGNGEWESRTWGLGEPDSEFGHWGHMALVFVRLHEILTWHTDIIYGGFKYFYFQPYLGKIPILTHIFQLGWNRQLVISYWIYVYRIHSLEHVRD